LPSLLVIAGWRLYLSAIGAASLLLACAPAEDRPDGRHTLSEPVAQETAPTATRGLWVLAEGSERVLEDRAKIPRLIEDATLLGASDLFVQVYRGGRAWYDSSLADPGPYRDLRAKNEDTDTLVELLEQAHAAGLRVHAWVNVLSLSRNQKAPILSDLGRDAILVDRKGRSVLDYPKLELPQPDRDWYRMGTRGVYLDAAAPGVAERLTATFEELIARYPALDGLHLDYIRHPGVLPFVPGSRFGVGMDFGYGAASRLRFQRETGLTGPFRNGHDRAGAEGQLINADAWDAWRRQKVTDLVISIREATQRVKPDLILSAAVNSYADRAYLSLAQDWKYWLEEGLIEIAIPMAYTRDDRLLRHQLESFAGMPDGERIWSGLGVWLFAREPARAVGQSEIATRAGIGVDVLFSYDSIVEKPALMKALVAAATALPPSGAPLPLPPPRAPETLVPADAPPPPDSPAPTLIDIDAAGPSADESEPGP